MPSALRTLTIGWLLLALTACNLPIVGTPAASATPPASATASQTPSPTPSPTPVPAARLDQAEWALFVGDWPTAMEAYQEALATTEDDELAGAAQLGLGATHMRAGGFGEAEQALLVFVEDYPAHLQAADGWFLLGLARMLQENREGAIEAFQQFLQAAPGQLDAYVHEHIGDMLRELDRPLESIPHYQAAVEAPKLGGTLVLQVKIGLAHFEANQYEPALAAFDGVYAAAVDDSTKATANFLAGRVLEAMGDPQAAYARYQDSLNNHPEAYDTYSGLVRLVEAGIPVDDFQRAIVDYYAGAYEPALRAFNQAEVSNPASVVYYYRGLTLRQLAFHQDAVADFAFLVENYPESNQWGDAWMEKALTEWAYLGDREAAIASYVAFADAAPEHPRTPEALLAAGQAAERAGQLETADGLWWRLVESYPASAQASEAAFDAGVVRFRLGAFAPAGVAFQRSGELAGGSQGRAAAFFWLGKVAEAQGDPTAAETAWQQAAGADPTGYYSLRAEDRLAGRAPFESLGVYQFEEDRQAARLEAEAWLRQVFTVDGPEPLTELEPAWLADPRVVRGQAFWRLGLYVEAKAEFEAVRQEMAGDAEATYRLIHHLLDLGHYQPAIFAARHILDLAGLDDAGTLEAPRYFNLIRFGAYYGDLVLPAAAEQGFDPLFVLSVVRQESLFEGFATSYAEARGLMQVIPTTGAEIAAQLGWPPDYSSEDLYRPIVSVRFGTHYLALQRSLFEGDLVAALTAYNAGPGNALAWKETVPDDPDLYVEIVRIEQPQLYVRSIYEVYRIYQDLYVEPSAGL